MNSHTAARSARLQTPLRATAAAARAVCSNWSPAVLGLLMLGAAPVGDAWAQAALTRNLPNPCSLTNACTYKPNGAGTPQQIVTLGQGVTATTSGNQMTVTQSTGTSLLNWRTFDIAAGNTVNFKGPVSGGAEQSFVSINRIHDTQASRIDGNLFAPKGQVYLINSNGLMFGNSAVLDVAGLIASTLDISETRLTKGLLADSAQRAAFSLSDANPLAAAAKVQIERGAVIKAGNVYVFAPTIENSGSLQVTAGGQVVLAAGQRVYLAGSEDVALRGLLVEVGQGGTVTHSGDIQTPRGNTTLVGMAVNQGGRITATSALNENGSIRLVAREVASGTTAIASLFSGEKPSAMFAQATATGSVTVASGSTTQVLLDRSDLATAALSDSAAAAARSTLTIDGGQVAIGGNGAAGTTLLQAHGGDVKVAARTSLEAINAAGVGAAVLGNESASATLVVGADTRIDVSGEQNVLIDGNRNYVYIDRLTSNDLRDAPLQRDGFLRGQGVYVNVAKDQAFIDLTSRRAAVAGTQAERNAVGGNIVLHAEGAVTAAKGAQFDMAGGSTITSAASGRTSQLLTASGRVVDIMNARADEAYVGFADRSTVTLDAPREGLSTSTTYEAPRITGTAQFSEGRNAGSLEIVAPRGSFAGSISAGTSPGATQRSNLPQGGEVRIGSVAGSSANIDQQVAFSRANVLLTDDLTTVSTSVPATQQDRLIALDTTMLKAGGVTRLSVLSDGVATVNRGAALDMGPGGSLSLQGNAVDVNANLTAHGGSIAVGERPIAATDANGAVRGQRSLVTADERGQIRFGSDVSLDASGLFTNDTAVVSKGAMPGTPSAPIVRNGGNISITGAHVDVSSVKRFDVDAGASVSASGVVTGGKAGTLNLSAANTTVQTASGGDSSQLALGEAFADRISGFGFTAGGSLKLAAPMITVGSAERGDVARIDTAVFDRGFEAYNLRAAESFSVQAGTTIAPPVRQYTIDATLRAAADGAKLSTVARPQTALPINQRPATLTFAASGVDGSLSIEAGAVVNAGTQGAVQASAGKAIDVEGRLQAAGGSVALALGSPSLNDIARIGVDQLEQQAIRLGEQSVIDVSGVSRVQVNALGQRSGNVLDGGTVSIAATRGTFAMVPGAVIRADGAHDQIDLLGAGAATRIDVASRGGALSVSAQQGLFVDGSVSARSGGAGVEGGRLSVRFEGLNRNEQGETVLDPLIGGTLFASDRVLTLGGSGTLPDAGGAFVASEYAGHARIKTSLVNGSGFDTVLLASTNTIDAPTSVALKTAGSITLDAQAMSVGPGATLSVTAPTVTLGFTPAALAFAPNQNPAATGGTGTLDVAATRQVNLVGTLALQGVGQSFISAHDDVSLRGAGAGTGVAGDLRPQGRLTTAGDLTISAAQLTPVSMTDYTVALEGNPGARLTITSPEGSVALEPLSAAGTVSLKAPDIAISGRITAPQGGIRVEAGQSATLAPGAVLSVAGTLDVPLGTVFNGSQWVYSDDPNNTTSNLASNAGVTTALADKRISVTGATVDVDPKARLELSGGGNMVAQEFVAGPGGSIDIRQNFVPTTPGATTTQRNNLFALIPARGDHAAAYDPQAYADLTQDAARGGSALLRIGQTITLGAGSGVPAGTYTVMPARYALLPGAYALQAVTGYTDLQPGKAVREAAGTVIVAGRLGVDGAGASGSRWSGYRIYSGPQLRKLAELRDYSGSAFTSAAAAAAGEVAPRTALDAGALSIAAEQVRLSLASVHAQAGSSTTAGARSTGRGMELSLAAPHLVVSDQPATASALPSDTLALNVQNLSDLKAETLVLGAAATHGDGSAAQRGTLTLSHAAQSVAVGGMQTLSAGEVLLAGSAQVSVGVGTAIAADAEREPTTSAVASSGDGAALLVSSAAALPTWARSGSTGAAGDLRLDEAARLSGRSVLFDASHEQRYAASVALDAKHIGLSASRVNLGEVPVDASGLSITNALLAQFNSADSFQLSSGSVFDVYGDARVGSASLKSLVLDGAGFVAHGAADGAAPSASATITAGDVSLRNSAGALPADTLAGGSGALVITAVGGAGAKGNLSFDGGTVAARGFASTTLIATGATGATANAGAVSTAGTGQLLLAGKTGSFTTDGDLTLDAARIAASSGAQQSVVADGLLRTLAGSAASTDTSQALGATLALSGQRIEHGGRIELPSGIVSLTATGAGAGDDVTLAAGSRIGVAGSTQSFAGQTADASAGAITLGAAAGSVRALAGSTLDLNGAGRNGDAGALHVSAGQGTLQLDGSLLATAGTAARGAELSVDVGRLADLGSVTRPLALATGGAQALALDVRVRHGDVELKTGDSASAHNIRIAADGADFATNPRDGQLLVNGTLDASGSRAGRVELYARDSIALGSASRIAAQSSGAGEEGGSVLLSARINEAAPTSLDAIRIAPGATVDVSGPAGSSAAVLGGTVTLRAPSVGNDVAIAALPTNYLTGAREEIVEATTVKAYTGNLALNASAVASAANPLPSLRVDLLNTMSSAYRAAMTERLGRTGDAEFHLRPGLEIRSSGNISVASAIDFAAGLDAGSASTGNFPWRYGGSTFATSEPGALTLRAGGDVSFTGGLLDGFVTAATGNVNAKLLPYAGDSWRYQVTAGADRTAAAAASTSATASAGSVVLQPSGLATNPAIIRTGTGRIDIAAAKDITLKGANVAVYSGGMLAADSQAYADSVSNTTLLGFNPTFTEHGGGVTLEAGRDIVASVPSIQLINNWLWRAGAGTQSVSDGVGATDFSGAANAPTAWWVNAGTFSQGVGALGGGDVAVKAGNDVRSLTAVVPSNGHLVLDAQGHATTLVEHNGGALDVQAGGAIKGGAFYAERGEFNLRADSIVRQSGSDLVFLAQGDNTARVQARGGIDSFGSFNPTLAPTLALFDTPAVQKTPANATFTTYGEDSQLDLRSLTGDVSVAGRLDQNRVPTTGTLAITNGQKGRTNFDILPGTVDLVAFGGDVNVTSSKLMAPAASGQLRVLAGGNVGGDGSGAVVMAALDPQVLPSTTTPVTTAAWNTRAVDLRGLAAGSADIVIGETWGLTRPANHDAGQVLHAADAVPAFVVARNGDIDGLRIEVPKPLVAEAAGAIRDAQLLAQNLNDASVTQVHAGGAITMGGASPNITITGPGVAEVLAGAAINLGSSLAGITTRGNLVNGLLPDKGATLIVAAGLGRGEGGFVQQPDYANVLRQFVAHDAFAAAGRDAASLNAQVLADADFGDNAAQAAGIRASLQSALQARSDVQRDGSAFNTWLAQLPAATRMRVVLELAQRVQAVANQRFVATANTESFAPGYLALHDLFPTLSSNAAGLRQFITSNPFAGADNANALRTEALKGAPDALVAVLQRGLNDPAQASDPSSAFNAALAALDPALLASGSRQLFAQVQALAGSTLDALRAAGRVGAAVGTPFAKGLDSFARAFSPAGPVASNDITLVFSQIKAEQSGDVLLLAPRGGVLAGLANPPAGVTNNKQAYELGVLTLGGGDITSMVRDNFDVYRSRVFTVAGGDIHLWASLGNIDAGRGPRDTVVAPPPRLLVDTETGLVTLDVTASVSGSGIGALKTRDDQAPSSIRLIAPNGFIDAGEAGIRADTGTVTLGTTLVLNGGNISAGGSVSGGAVVTAPPAPLPQSASSTGSADKAVEQTQRNLSAQQTEAEERAKKERRKRVTGEFIGFGDD